MANYVSSFKKEKASFDDALEAANGLKSVNGENPEYDRALCELIVDMFEGKDGMESARKVVADTLGIELVTGLTHN